MSTDATTTPADGVLEQAGDRQVIRFERRLAHPIERVWAALTDPAELLGWWGEAEVELVEGGRFTLRWLNVDDSGERYTMRATITRLDPPRLLETTGDRHGTLRWELRPVAGGTLLTFSSTLALPAAERAKSLAGWHYHLDALAAALAGRSVELADLPNARWHELHEQYLARLA